MKHLKIRRLATLTMAAALVCGSSLTVFADWPSFQKNTANNGYVVSVTSEQDAPLTGSLPTSIQAIDLETEGYPFVGVDAETVISGNYAYTLYNGGTVANGKGGTRMRATDLTTRTKFWDRQIFPSSNVEQLATPVINGTTIYAAINEDSTLFSSDSLNKQIPFGSEGVDVEIEIASNLEVPSDLEGIQVSTNLSYTPESGEAAADSITGQIVLVNTEEEGAAPISLGENEYYGGNMIFYNLSGTVVPKGTYDLKLQVTNKTAEGNTLTLTTADVTIPTWDLVEITDITSEVPAVAYLTNGPEVFETVEGEDIYQGYGEPATPLKIFDNMLYFGINDGDRCYYQYNIAKGEKQGGLNKETTERFAPEGYNDFYWAGAAMVSEEEGKEYIVFGSDDGILYTLPTEQFNIVDKDNNPVGFAYNLKNQIEDVGRIRSSIVTAANGDIYFTSQGGYLLCTTVTDLIYGDTEDSIEYVNLADELGLTSAESVSTPTITADGTIYVGYSTYEGTNEVGGVWIGKSGTSGITYTNKIDMQAPVDSSPLVYNDGTADYVYFTTNNGSGAGYCWKITNGAPDTAATWTVGSDPSSGSYTLQGMSVGANGTLVFGNDLEKLYVIPNTSQTPPESETTADAGEDAAETEAVTEAAAE